MPNSTPSPLLETYLRSDNLADRLLQGGGSSEKTSTTPTATNESILKNHVPKVDDEWEKVEKPVNEGEVKAVLDETWEDLGAAKSGQHQGGTTSGSSGRKT
ncbi:hypothetical protein QQS21_005307 [Conoideocrella luteorostrata]|uniref:Uncharacterized protein n=1 Tax=Conoideocrella luteorostrata TaxID=1105319 RepID=A0AAJ0FUK0_9HYPO|nr:hypothetical protein QQS21_005307 [Conoideocrella luteorostrata]